MTVDAAGAYDLDGDFGLISERVYDYMLMGE